MPFWDPQYTVVDLSTGEEHGPLDSEAEAAACIAYLRLTPDQVEIIVDSHPLARSVGWE